jgi:hypothetical protein
MMLLRKRISVLSTFPMFCPEPVLGMERSKKDGAFFRPESHLRFRLRVGEPKIADDQHVWIVKVPKKNATLFLSFPYVCPEPVLVK